MYSTSDLELATRHVEEGKARIEKLRELGMRLKRNGRPTDQVEHLLDSFECILERMRWHKEFIEARLLRSGFAVCPKADKF